MTALENMAERTTRVARARQLIGEISIHYPPQIELKVALDELRQTAAMTRGRPQRGVHLFGPSFAGKTTAAREHAKHVRTTEEYRAGAVPIAIATIDPEGSLASVATDILRAIGEPRPDKGSAALRWERVWNSLPERDVQILVLDEFQRAARRPTMSPVIAAKIQDLMEAGLCAVAFLGLEKAHDVFLTATDLSNRLDVPVTMTSLQWADDEDRQLFTDFVDRYDDALVNMGVMSLRSELAGDEQQLQLLHESSNGLIGQFCRIVETAAISVVRNRHSCISREDLADAVDDWSIANRRIDYNPFRDGER